MCSLTQLRLPSFFLEAFQLKKHPQTKDLWWQPTKAIPNKFGRPKAFERVGPSAYVLGREEVVQEMTNGKKVKNYRGSLSSKIRMREAPDFKSAKWVWRDDMPEFVLQHRRLKVAEQLEKLSRRPSYVVGVESLPEASSMQDVGAILYLGPPKPESSMIDGSMGTPKLDTEAVPVPGEFATVTMTGSRPRKVPVHHLSKLLGEGPVAKLRLANPSLTLAPYAVLKSMDGSAGLQCHLWKLQGYLASYEDF
jgi:hypothetical protein